MPDTQATMTLDHVVSVFIVTVKTFNGLTAQDLKDQIQKKYEVVDISDGSHTWVPTIHRD